MSVRLLLVEDDRLITDGLGYSLRREGYEVECAATVAQAKRMADAGGFDLCLLDVTLPDGDGHEVCRYIKQRGDVPVIFLTACDDESHTVMALEQGADDYITKPFRLRELTARIAAVLRRTGRAQAAVTSLTGGVEVDASAGRVTRNGEEISLTAVEYRLLMAFVANRGGTLSRTQLLDSLWDSAGDFVNDNTLTVYINRLRRKLSGDDSESVIKTVRGIGYRVD